MGTLTRCGARLALLPPLLVLGAPAQALHLLGLVLQLVVLGPPTVSQLHTALARLAWAHLELAHAHHMASAHQSPPMVSAPLGLVREHRTAPWVHILRVLARLWAELALHMLVVLPHQLAALLLQLE